MAQQFSVDIINHDFIACAKSVNGQKLYTKVNGLIAVRNN